MPVRVVGTDPETGEEIYQYSPLSTKDTPRRRRAYIRTAEREYAHAHRVVEDIVGVFSRIPDSLDWALLILSSVGIMLIAQSEAVQAARRASTPRPPEERTIDWWRIYGEVQAIGLFGPLFVAAKAKALPSTQGTVSIGVLTMIQTIAGYRLMMGKGGTESGIQGILKSIAPAAGWA